MNSYPVHLVMSPHMLPSERERSRFAAEQYVLQQGLREQSQARRRARTRRLRRTAARALARAARAVDADRLPA